YHHCIRLSLIFFFFSSRRRHTRFSRDWSSDVCSSDLAVAPDHWTEGPHYPELPQLLAAGFAPDAVLLTPGDARQAASWLESLRRSEERRVGKECRWRWERGYE